jgi:hypothetical protein
MQIWQDESMRLILLFLFLFGCGSGQKAASGESWPEADALFHQDPRWQGADAAFSIDLGDNRTLWLFGDSFIATSPMNTRTESRFIRNSVAVQTGRDPTRATMQFAWGTATDNGPASYFPENGSDWHWPLSGAVVNGVLVVFLMVVHATPGQGLGFGIDSWRLVRIDNYTEAPSAWRKTFVDPPQGPNQALVGVAVAREGSSVLAFTVSDGDSHRGRLARFNAADLAAGNLSSFAFWTGSDFTPHANLGGTSPTVIIDDIAPEASVHYDLLRKRWVHVASVGFGASKIAVRLAPSAQGPWPDAEEVFEPPESRQPNPFVYAAKAHPQLDAQSDALVVTYATNSFTFSDLFTPAGRANLYWPRFVRLRWLK